MILALENVISGNMEESAFDGNLLGIEVGKKSQKFTSNLKKNF